MSLRQYLVDLRIRRAAKLLRATNLPVTDIAYEVGFESLSGFYAAFRRRMGAPPARFRRAGAEGGMPA